MALDRNPLLETLRNPNAPREFPVDDWNLLLRQAKRERVLARLGFMLEDAGATGSCPPRVTETLRSARAYIDFHQVQIRREIRRIARVLGDIDTSLVLLKGGAYLEAGLPLARGRHMADIDLLVPRDRIPVIEERLRREGWEPQELDSYDQRYYREWMHEIPPLKHPAHGIEIDIHHALLPLTARVRPDPDLLRESARPVGDGRFRVLSPPDMVLHSATQVFYDGEIAGDLRGLLDLRQMLLHFGAEADFWSKLQERARQLGLSRALYYSLHFCDELLGTSLPAQTLSGARQNGAPPQPIGRLMDLLIEPVLTPWLPDASGAPIASWLLFVRSHWLRMPPTLLAAHLGRKAWRRVKSAQPAPA